METDEELKGSMLMLPDSSLKRGWRKQRDEHSEQADDTKCGLGVCKPSCLHCCGTMGAFTAVYCLSGLITTALQAYIASQITALERHFGFSSAVSGFLVSSNEIGFLSVTIIMSYLIRKMHIPRMLSATTFLYGISGLMCVIPYLLTKDQLTPPSGANVSSVFQTGPLCNSEVKMDVTPSSNLTDRLCEETKFSYVHDSTMRKIAVAIIGAGMIVQGICKAPRSPGLVTYIDDNVTKTKTPLYMGIIMGSGICAMALAFGVGGIFSKMFITLGPTSLTPMHPRWVGAWWLGFLVFGGGALAFSIPLMCFPRKMRTADDKHDIHAKKPVNISGFLGSIVRLISNPVFFPIVIGNCITFISLGGVMAFLPKYLETQFTMPSWKSNMILGGVSIITNCVGTITGGVVTSRLKLTPLTCLKIALGVLIFSLVIQSSAVLLGCPNPVISKGGSALSNDTKSNFTYGVSLTTAPPSVCNNGCGCTDQVYFPMCGADGVNYFNPCYAGCSQYNNTDYTYDDCACVEGSKKTATPGLCQSDCPFFFPFLGLSVVGGFIMTMAAMPVFIAIIRSVSEEDKPVSLGLSGFLGTLLGFLPGPILFGWIIDTTCLHWNTGCGGKGACALYDIEKFRYLVMGIPAASRVLTVLLYAFALCMAHRPGSHYRKYEEEHGTKEEKLKMNPTKPI